MLTSRKKAQADKEAALIEGRDSYIASLQAWLKRYAELIDKRKIICED
ncbi:hypothetical protein [Microbulbifer epialgicus]|uniref:Uncharacterized protein n=1 Tax=Microbulbifer epialgicus TaxID=393907 RepID=A0ABV4NUG0_9GAMM